MRDRERERERERERKDLLIFYELDEGDGESFAEGRRGGNELRTQNGPGRDRQIGRS